MSFYVFVWPVAWKQKFTSLYKGKESKNANKKRKNENFEKQKMRFFLISQGSLNPKIRFLGQKVCPVAQTDLTDRHTYRVTTEGTLSGLQDFFLQPIIKDRLNNLIVIL